MKKTVIVFLALLLIAPGCSWFKDKKEKTAEQLSSEGLKSFEKGKYTDAIESFEKLKDWYPFSKYAILAELKLADSYFHRGNYEDAVYAYEYFESLHPRNDAIPYVIFQMGMCHFKEMTLPDRDQTATQSALDNFERLVREHPQSSEAARALEYVKICQENLARHDMFAGAFYFKSKRFKAALGRFNDVLKSYPDVGVHKPALEYVALCNAYLAKDQAKSEKLRQETLDDRKEAAEKARKKFEKKRAGKGLAAASRPETEEEAVTEPEPDASKITESEVAPPEDEDLPAPGPDKT